MEQNTPGGVDPFDIADQASGQRVDLGPVIDAEPLKNRDQGRPICRRHACLMIANGSREQLTYYKCPVDGCDSREVKVRQQYQDNVMRNPLYCGICKNDTAMEIDVETSKKTPGLFQMQCPKCGGRAQIHRPDIVRFIAKPRETFL
jgi:hypothetical protein